MTTAPSPASGQSPDPALSAGGLTLEQYVSVAEEVVQRTYPAAAHEWVMPDKANYPKAYNNPDFWAAMAPVTAHVHSILQGANTPRPHLKVVSGGWHIDQTGNAGSTDGMNWIELRNPATALTILHECAHVIRGRGYGHDPEFVTVLAGLLTEHISPAAANQFTHLVSFFPATTAPDQETP